MPAMTGDPGDISPSAHTVSFRQLPGHPVEIFFRETAPLLQTPPRTEPARTSMGAGTPGEVRGRLRCRLGKRSGSAAQTFPRFLKFLEQLSTLLVRRRRASQGRRVIISHPLRLCEAREKPCELQSQRMGHPTFILRVRKGVGRLSHPPFFVPRPRRS